MTSREKRFIVVGAVILTVAAAGAVFSSIRDGRHLRLENPLDPLPYIQARREQARRKQCQENLRKIGLAIRLYSDAAEAGPVVGTTEASGGPKSPPTADALKLPHPQKDSGASAPAPEKQEP